MIYRLNDLIRLVRERSPFYRDLYKNLPASDLRIQDLPVLDQSAFWAANGLRDNQVLTGPLSDGVLYKSGGTTGSPKFSVFTRDEWRTFTGAFGRGMNANGLRAGERVANLFYSGELYASFLFITSSIENAPEPALQLPITGSASHETIAHSIQELQADVLAGVPTSLLSLAEFIAQTGKSIPSIKRILFGGEAIYEDQRKFLEKVFPNVEIRSIGYASVDAGLLGYADLDCGPNEHRVFSAETIVEIIDEATGEEITETGRAGKLVVTNLTRLMMPIIRYPAGDRAEWVDESGGFNRKFRLLGRSEEGARVGPATLYYEDLAKLLEPHSSEIALKGFQLVLDHKDMKDLVTLRTAVSNIEAAQSKKTEILRDLLKTRPMVATLVDQGLIHMPAIEVVKTDDLLTNHRTGKIRRVVDRRQDVVRSTDSGSAFT